MHRRKTIHDKVIPAIWIILAAYLIVQAVLEYLGK
jgi:hypothetical protein